jgi:hypothetical protein
LVKEVKVYKLKVIAGILCVIALLVVVGCQGEPETFTVTSTTSVQAPVVTTTSTVTSTPPAQTQTITQMITVTQTVTVPSGATTTTQQTTTTDSGFTPVDSPDGKLQITEARYSHPATSDNYVLGTVKNMSDEVLSARVTAEFLTATGAVAQTKWVKVSDLAPGEEKSFSVKADLYVGEFFGFNVYVEVWE